MDDQQRGLNQPNIYYILKLPDLTPSPNGNGHPGPENISGPDRKRTSAQDRNAASDKEDALKNTKVVNALPTNDRKKPSERGKSQPTISDRALRAKYSLTDEQLGQVHYLVERQASLLGSVERNHAHYVKRAAEAVVRAGHVEGHHPGGRPQPREVPLEQERPPIVGAQRLVNALAVQEPMVEHRDDGLFPRHDLSVHVDDGSHCGSLSSEPAAGAMRRRTTRCAY